MELHLTPAARAAAERDLRTGESIRIAFAGGCGAMGFRLAGTRRVDADDLRLTVDGIALALDRMAASQLDGATLDYDEDEGFRVDHPSWGISCG
jgi:Fe-S cluster assembly iron-binding protein IscA